MCNQRLLLVVVLAASASCKIRQNPFDILCRETTAIAENNALGWDEKTVAFQTLVRELDSREVPEAVVATAKYEKYKDYLEVTHRLATVAHKEKGELLEIGAREAGMKDWTCPGFQAYFNRYRDRSQMKAGCKKGSLSACYDLARFEKEAGNFGEAIGLYGKVCKEGDELGYEHASACGSLGELHRNQADRAGAIVAYAAACAIDTEHCYEVGKVELDAGNVEQARMLHTKYCGNNEHRNCDWLERKIAEAAPAPGGQRKGTNDQTTIGLDVELPVGWVRHANPGGPTEFRPLPDGTTGILQVSRLPDKDFPFISKQSDLGQFAVEMGTRLGKGGQSWGHSRGGQSGDCAMGRYGFAVFTGGQFPAMLLWITVSDSAAYMWTWLGPDIAAAEVRGAVETVLETTVSR